MGQDNNGENMLKISDYSELLALHKTIMEAKFNDSPNNFDIIPSTIVANIANRTIEALIKTKAPGKISNSKEKWDKWRKITKDRHEWYCILKDITRRREWRKWSIQDKEAYLKIAFSPLIFTDKELLDELVSWGDFHWIL